MRRFVVPGFVFAMLLVGCADAGRYETRAASAAAEEVALPMAIIDKPGGRAVAEPAQLAYEHEVGVRLPEAEVVPTMQAARRACEARKFGACLVLSVKQSGGSYPDASLTVRAEAKAIEPLIGMAGKGGDVESRHTSAEDLSVVIRDNALLRERLRKQHARLLEFQDGRDLKVEDVIALSEQLSKVEAELEAADRDAANHTRRVETQLLTLNFSPVRSVESRSEVAEAFADTGRVMAASTATVVRVIAALIPVLIALVAGTWLLRLMWRWVQRRKRVEE